MIDVYEVNVQAWCDDHRYEVEHRFPSLPEVQTLVALKFEACVAFRELFDTEHEGASVYVMYLSADERNADEAEHAVKPS